MSFAGDVKIEKEIFRKVKRVATPKMQGRYPNSRKESIDNSYGVASGTDFSVDKQNRLNLTHITDLR